nr:hypothetical protein [Tanacetum cinerariifolium]
GSKVEEQAPKALMVIDGVGWDWSFIENGEEDHALVADEEAPTEFSLMAKTSAELSIKNMLFHYKAGLSQDEGRLTEIPEFADDTITDYTRPSPSVESNPSDLQNSSSSASENGESTSGILSKPEIKFGNSQNHIDDKGYSDSGCSRHITGNISYLSDYEPFDEGYVSFGQGGCKITGKGTIKTGKLEFENVYFVKDLKYNLFSVSQICDNKNSVLFTDSECIMLGRDFKLIDDTNVLFRTLRQHTMYSIDLNNIVPHKDLTCLVAKASADEVVTDDFSRFTWTFFLKTKDETSGILRNFITEIENLKELRNGVAERRNKTLIEAVRTMLADAKLPITFWAEAVNTACYVQNRVLVNKSQNKTPYELFNSRTPAIGFLKPFGCHVMILNTLDDLGKFKAKRDEGYFIGYSMSSKAFRVFNKRTKRVEEKLHVDFLENKPIEKGAGPNWLFDIDTLTNSMNYVPVVVADTCNADAPKSSENFNLTATSTNPSADHIETLAVETLIPTVSSLVPTACLNDSPEPSSDTTLISKRVTSQDDTPSFDNILTLTNRFEDILGVTTNTYDTIGVEADHGNMEITITASPTPTLRIHKDHSKSQIIGPVDTPIQTRKKSKEMKEQSFIATIHQKTNAALLQFCLFSCFLSQEEPKKISDALQDPSWVEAMTKWVLKNKKDERGIIIKNKARLVAQGHTQEERIDYDEVFVPVARIEPIRLFLAYASFMGFTVYQMDVKSAFLYGTIDEEVYVIQPPGL